MEWRLDWKIVYGRGYRLNPVNLTSLLPQLTDYCKPFDPMSPVDADTGECRVCNISIPDQPCDPCGRWFLCECRDPIHRSCIVREWEDAEDGTICLETMRTHCPKCNAVERPGPHRFAVKIDLIECTAIEVEIDAWRAFRARFPHLCICWKLRDTPLSAAFVDVVNEAETTLVMINY